MNPVVYIKIPTHIRQWAYHAYGNPVVFPAGGNEVAVIRKFTTKPPSAKLSLVELESQTEQEAADSAKFHQSVSHIFKDNKASIEQLNKELATWQQKQREIEEAKAEAGKDNDVATDDYYRIPAGFKDLMRFAEHHLSVPAIVTRV